MTRQRREQEILNMVVMNIPAHIIAKRLGCAASLIHYYKKKHGLMKNTGTEARNKRIIRMATEGLTVTEIAEKTGYTYSAVYAVTSRNEVKATRGDSVQLADGTLMKSKYPAATVRQAIGEARKHGLTYASKRHGMSPGCLHGWLRRVDEAGGLMGDGEKPKPALSPLRALRSATDVRMDAQGMIYAVTDSGRVPVPDSIIARHYQVSGNRRLPDGEYRLILSPRKAA